MARSACRISVLLMGTLTLAMAACDRSPPAGPETPAAVAASSPDASPPTPAAEDEALSPEAWSEQARQSAAATTPEDMAAEGAAAGRAMAETCGFTDAEMRQFKAREHSDQHGAGFEARVDAHMPRLRQAQQAQQRENSAAYQENCEFLRFMLDNRG